MGVRVNVSQNLTKVLETQAELVEKTQKRNAEIGKRAFESYLDAFETSLDAWSTGVDETRNAVELGLENVEETRGYSVEAFRRELELGVEVYGELARSYSEAFDGSSAIVEEVVIEAEDADEGDDRDEEIPPDSVQRVNGIGPTYADRLADAGITTLDELADADPDDVAEAADVSVENAEEWIQKAVRMELG